MTVETTSCKLSDLMKQIDNGELQLPDFQREWKWDNERIVNLIASILAGHPIGVLMLLEVGDGETPFAATPLSGAKNCIESNLRYLLLDGQQRLTSLFQALYSDLPVQTKDGRKKPQARWYYMSLAKALTDSTEVEQVILSIPEDRKPKKAPFGTVTPDVSSLPKECEEEMFPLSRCIDANVVKDWMKAYVARDATKLDDRLDRWNQFDNQFLSQIRDYRIPAIILRKDTPREAVCTVFERVNTGGVALNVFELLTAAFAASKFQLKDDWNRRLEQLEERKIYNSSQKRDQLQSTDFLQVISLLTTYNYKLSNSSSGNKPHAVSCKRKDILRLELSDYRRFADAATEGFEWAAAFLEREGIFAYSDVPYKTQIVPLAALRATFGKRIGNFDNMDKVRKWYWCAVFGELYASTVETRINRDFEQVAGWIKHGNSLPGSISEAEFSPSRLLVLRRRNSAIHKGIHALLIRNGCLDWLKDQPIRMATTFDSSIDIHHIFPKKWFKDNGLEDDRCESIVNKTLISSDTNRFIGGKAPSLYLQVLQKEAGIGSQRQNEILETHLIDGNLLRNDDFDEFFKTRMERIVQIIGDAMGKKVTSENFDDESNS